MSDEDERAPAPPDRLGSGSAAASGAASGAEPTYEPADAPDGDAVAGGRAGSRHVSGEQVADLLEDLLPGDEAATVSAHLDDCSTCARLRDDLAAVPALLAAVPPPPMPVDVAQRLDAVVAQAAAERRVREEQTRQTADAQSSRPAAVTTSATSSPARRRRFAGSFAGALTGIAAAAAVVVGVVVIGEVTTQGDSAEDSAASDGSISADGEAATGDHSARLAGPGIDSDAFRVGVRRTFAGTKASLEGDETLRPTDSAVDRATGACPRPDLAAAGIPGRYGPEVRLDGEPVTLVATGPKRDSLVVAYSCATGSPVPQVRARVDLTR